jgi:hypothetical protein
MAEVETFFKEPKKKRQASAKSLKARATEAHSLYVRARDRACARCGLVKNRMECAHIFSRGYSATRTDELNAVALCSGCHRYLTRNPHEHVEFFQTRLGLDVYHALKEKAYQGTKGRYPASYWQAEITRLEELLRGVR